METARIISTVKRQPSNLQSGRCIEQGADNFECGLCYYQSRAKDFAPITVSADFSALECPKCLNNDKNSFQEVISALKQAA